MQALGYLETNHCKDSIKNIASTELLPFGDNNNKSEKQQQTQIKIFKHSQKLTL
tara:strand:- start:58 stop:219 length:162 start_codon:yes stop_codon:yes gene_type:complete